MGIIKVRILMTLLLEFTLEFIKDYAKLTFLKSRLDIFEYLLVWNYWSLRRHLEKSHNMCFADQWDHSSSAWCYFIRISIRKYNHVSSLQVWNQKNKKVFIYQSKVQPPCPVYPEINLADCSLSLPPVWQLRFSFQNIF